MNQDVLVFHLAMWVYQKVVRYIYIYIYVSLYKILKPYDCCAQLSSLYEYGILYQSSLLAVPRSRSGQMDANVSSNDLTICVMFIFSRWVGNDLLTETWVFVGTSLDSDMVEVEIPETSWNIFWVWFGRSWGFFGACNLHVSFKNINLATGHQLIHEELVLLVHGFLRDWRHRCRQLLSSMGSADRISDESPSPDGRKYFENLVQEDSEVVVSNWIWRWVTSTRWQKMVSNCFYFYPIPREMIQFDEHMVSNGLVQPPNWIPICIVNRSLSLSNHELEKATIITPYSFKKEPLPDFHGERTHSHDNISWCGHLSRLKLMESDSFRFWFGRWCSLYSIASTVTVSDFFHFPKACPNYWGL